MGTLKKTIAMAGFVIGIWLTFELVARGFYAVIAAIAFKTAYVGIGPYMPSVKFSLLGPVMLLTTWKEGYRQIRRLIKIFFDI